MNLSGIGFNVIKMAGENAGKLAGKIFDKLPNGYEYGKHIVKDGSPIKTAVKDIINREFPNLEGTPIDNLLDGIEWTKCAINNPVLTDSFKRGFANELDLTGLIGKQYQKNNNSTPILNNSKAFD